MSPFRSILAKMAAAAAKAIKDSNQNLLSIAVREDAIAAYKENQSSDEPIPAINNEHSMSITNVRDKANEAAYRNASVQADKDMKLCFIKNWLFQALGKEHVEFMELGTVDELFDYYKKQLSERCRPNLSTCVETLTKLKAIQLYSGQNDSFINKVKSLFGKLIRQHNDLSLDGNNELFIKSILHGISLFHESICTLNAPLAKAIKNDPDLVANLVQEYNDPSIVDKNSLFTEEQSNEFAAKVVKVIRQLDSFTEYDSRAHPQLVVPDVPPPPAIVKALTSSKRQSDKQSAKPSPKKAKQADKSDNSAIMPLFNEVLQRCDNFGTRRFSNRNQQLMALQWMTNSLIDELRRRKGNSKRAHKKIAAVVGSNSAGSMTLRTARNTDHCDAMPQPQILTVHSKNQGLMASKAF
eukprot:TRINITY_DN12521_c2_g1_i1.p1 TRINITY_DN12521_c2_g1~~TRINITY_DN12521_c2_g1_i1.p1  ORF type:complete len:410 (+),score=102.15 TRINITY_DN12521_c2_g1_i1:254-1483(+)